MDIEQQVKVFLSGDANVVPLQALKDKLKKGTPLRVKLGVDPTAPDLHLGHAVPLRKLRQLQDLGHQVVLIIGDGTALIGDPSGRNSTRPPLTPEQIAENAQTYVNQAFKILDKDKTELTWNASWLTPLNLGEILKLASQFTVARTLERDDFANRYKNEQSIALHEFLYPVMQAYDSVVIKADVEIGGTDQLFNLLAGRELMEKLGMEPQVCLTLPLLEGTDGKQKMSKSYGNYIGINDEPAEMFGKVMSIPDELMPRYFYLTSSFSLEEIEARLAALADETLHPNKAKRELAANIVTEYWGTDAARVAEEAFDKVFKLHELPEDIELYEGDVVLDAAGEVYLPVLLTQTGLASSASDARRLIDNGGVKIAGQAQEARSYNVAAAALKGAVLQVGKRKYIQLP
ncbi:MAG: tyrosine--tRNA ligase [Coriobacteriales bacterium]|nr:tyrosine--tRNA ligase [Coriobacteriales bacterium]